MPKGINNYQGSIRHYTNCLKWREAGTKATMENLTGKTYEELYGKEVAAEKKRRLSNSVKKLWENPEYRSKSSKSHIGNTNALGHKMTPGRRALESKRAKELWKRPSYRMKQTMSIIKNLNLKPNKAEMVLVELLEDYFPNKFKFNNGWFILRGLIPDFPCIDGKKCIIELAGEHRHTEEEMQHRVDLFKSLGYDTLVIWFNEKFKWNSKLKDEDSLVLDILFFLHYGIK